MTDATTLLDGRIVLRTATELITWDAARTELGRAPLPGQEKGQALTWAIEPGRVLAAAGAGGQVDTLAIPGPAPATTTPRPSRIPNAQTQATADPAENHTFAQTGTTASVAIAAALAAIAGLVVVLRRR